MLSASCCSVADSFYCAYIMLGGFAVGHSALVKSLSLCTILSDEHTADSVIVQQNETQCEATVLLYYALHCLLPAT